MILCDTNIFIHAFNRHQPTIDALTTVGFSDIVLSSITVMELYRGMSNKAELAAMRRKLAFYDVVQLDAYMSKKAIYLIAQFKLSHNLQIPDALIGATAGLVLAFHCSRTILKTSFLCRVSHYTNPERPDHN